MAAGGSRQWWEWFGLEGTWLVDEKGHVSVDGACWRREWWGCAKAGLVGVGTTCCLHCWWQAGHAWGYGCWRGHAKGLCWPGWVWRDLAKLIAEAIRPCRWPWPACAWEFAWCRAMGWSVVGRVGLFEGLLLGLDSDLKMDQNGPRWALNPTQKKIK